MDIIKGQKCIYKDAFGFGTRGEVFSVSEDKFAVYDGSSVAPQYNDSVMEFTEEDIGTRIWFE